jgi:hypothetical protein
MRNRTTRKTYLVLLLGLLFLTGDKTAQAQASSDHFSVREPFTELFSDPCIGEEVLIQGEVFVHGQSVGHDGQFSVTLHRNIHGDAIGLTTGIEYNYKQIDNFHERFTEPDGTFSFTDVANLSLLSPGSAPNLVITIIQHLTMNANGEITSEVLVVNPRCVG